MDALVSHDHFEAAELEGWSWEEPVGGMPHLACGFEANSYTAAATFALEAARAADDADHHPDIDIRYQRFARVTLTTHGSGGVTQLDLDLAATISELAATAGVTSGVFTPR